LCDLARNGSTGGCQNQQPHPRFAAVWHSVR
jgi:hypothetical protein